MHTQTHLSLQNRVLLRQTINQCYNKFNIILHLVSPVDFVKWTLDFGHVCCHSVSFIRSLIFSFVSFLPISNDYFLYSMFLTISFPTNICEAAIASCDLLSIWIKNKLFRASFSLADFIFLQNVTVG